MPPRKSSSPRKQSDPEKFFLIAAVVGSLILGAGFCSFLIVLNSREKNSVNDDALAIQSTESRLIPPDHPRQLVDFTLTDRTDRAVSRSDLNGKILVVDFLFTSCSLTCPYVNGQMAKIQQLTTNDPNVKLVSLTVDPRDDTPDILAQYGRRFGAQTNRWFLLTGKKRVLYNLIGQSFLARDTNDIYGYMPGNFAHTERIALVDSHGNLRGYFDGLNQNTPTAVADEINQLKNRNL